MLRGSVSKVIPRTSGAKRLLLARLLHNEANELSKTPLHDFHVSHGGKMVAFAGWSMPLVYSNLSIIKSTLHTRKSVSLFDVSHMSQLTVSGKDAEKFLEYVTVVDVQRLTPGSASLSVFTNAEGGIIDDCIVTRDGEREFFIVANAGCRRKVLEHLKNECASKSFEVEIASLTDRSLVALQGPLMSSVLQRGVSDDLSKLFFMKCASFPVFGVPGCRVSRCGYTGEDGVEISVPSTDVVQLVERLTTEKEVCLAGLGARDTLRLEAGLCLYGNDISEVVTPVEAGLSWCISKRRQAGGGFIGDGVILKQLKDRPAKKRVGLTSEGPPARGGAAIMSQGAKVGEVSSGCFSPSLSKNIAMAYVPKTLSKIGTKLDVQVRKNSIVSEVVKMPFVPSNYYTK